MNFIKKLLMALALLISCSSALADEDTVTFRMGQGVTNTCKSALYSVGFEKDFKDSITYRLDFGAWTDVGLNRRGAPFSSVLIGKRAGEYTSLNFTAMVGILIMGSPDSALALPFNFTEEVALGYQQVSVGYKHVSNAGIKEPNLGRDYVFLNLTFPLNY